MDITNEILARLQNGEKIEDIASELTNSINTANTTYEKAKKEAAEAAAREAAQESLRNDKVFAIDSLLAALADAAALWEFDNELIEAIEHIDAEEVVDAIDQSIPFIQKYIELQADLQDAVRAAQSNVTENKNEVPKEVKAAQPIDPLENFLNTFVRI